MLDAQMVSVDAVDEYGNTVLIVAAQNNNKKIVKVRARSSKRATRAADVLCRLFCGAGRMLPPPSASLNPLNLLLFLLTPSILSTPFNLPHSVFASQSTLIFVYNNLVVWFIGLTATLTTKTGWDKPVCTLLSVSDILTWESTSCPRGPARRCAIREQPLRPRVLVLRSAALTRRVHRCPGNAPVLALARTGNAHSRHHVPSGTGWPAGKALPQEICYRRAVHLLPHGLASMQRLLEQAAKTALYLDM
jgi:hypothetical protein